MEKENDNYAGLPRDKKQIAKTFAAVKASPLDSAIRDKLMFKAGQRSSIRRRIFWQSIAAVFAAVLGLSFYLRTEPTMPEIEAESDAYVQTPVKQHQADMDVKFADNINSRREYIEVINNVIDHGADALPEGKTKRTKSSQKPFKAGYFNAIDELLK